MNKKYLKYRVSNDYKVQNSSNMSLLLKREGNTNYYHKVILNLNLSSNCSAVVLNFFCIYLQNYRIRNLGIANF